MDNSAQKNPVLFVGDSIAKNIIKSHTEYPVAVESTVSAAIDRIHETDVRCIVSEYDLQDGDGIELIEVVRDSYGRLPIILWTDSGDETVASDAITAGVTEYLIRDEATAISDQELDRLAERIVDLMGEQQPHPRGNQSVESEHRFRSVFEEAFDAMLIVDDDAEYVDANPAACELFGLSREKLLGRSIDEFAAEDYDFETAWREFQESDRDRGIFPLVRPDGEKRLVEFAATPNILPGRHLSVLRDVTEQRRMEEELDEVFERITDAVHGLDDEWRFTYLNERAEELLGRTEEDLRGKYVWDEFPDALERSYREHYERAMETQEPVVFEEYSDAADTWLEVHAYPSETGLSVYFHDISERKQREQKLEQYETVVETVHDGIYAVDTDGTFVMVNDAFCEMTGYERDELLGSHATTIHDDEITPRAEGLVDEIVAGEREAGTIELDIHTKDGESIPGECRLKPFPLDGNYGRCGVVRDVTEREARERELRETTERLEAIIEASPNGITVLDEDGTVELWNAAAERIFGWTEDEVRGDIPPVIPDEYRASFEERLEQIRNGKRFSDLEVRRQTKEGELVDVSISTAPIRGSDGAITGTMAILQDISDRKERERELNQYETIVETVTDGICILNRSSEFIKVNDAFVELTGYSRDELLGSHASLVRPESLNEVFDHMQVSLDAGSPIESIEMEIETADGETRTIDARYVQFTHGTDSGRVGVWRNITDRKERERKLELFRDLVDHSSDGITVLDPETAEIIDVNEAWCQMLGYSKSELLSLSVLDIDPEFTMEGWLESARSVKRQGELILESTHQRKDGSTFPVEIKITQVSLDSEYLVAAVRDITERKERERELESEKEKFQALIETAPDPIFVADAETGEIVEANSAACRIRKQARDEIIGLSQSELHPEGEKEKYRSLFEQQADQGGTITRYDNEPIYLATTDGDRVPVSISARTVTLGERTLIHGIFRDISDQKQYRDSLEELDRAARNFIEAETDHEIAQRIVDVASDVLNLSGTAVYFYDDESGMLTPAAYSPSLEEKIGHPPTFSPGNSIAWRVYATKNQAVYDDVRSDDDVYNPGTPIRSELIIPLGEHGVFLAANTDIGAFDDLNVELAEVLTATAEAALNHVDRARQLQEQKRESQLRAQRLERVNQITEKIQSIIQAVIEADTRQEIQQTVCDRLADIDRFTFAWIGEPDYVQEELTPEAWAGPQHEYLEAVTLELNSKNGSPAIQTARQKESTAVSNIAQGVQQEGWRRDALLYDLRAVISIPLIYDELLHGVLTIYAPEPSAFDDRSSSVLTELGELIGYALSSVDQQANALDTDLVELTFELSDPTDTFVKLSSRIDAELEIRNISSRSGDSYLAQVLAYDVEPGKFENVASEFVAIDEIRAISAGNPALFELIVLDSCIVTTAAEYGVTSSSIVIAEGGSQMSITVPQNQDIRAILEQIQEQYPVMQFTGRQTTQRPDPSGLSVLLEQLTDRQRDVLQAAYYGGFFEQPRQSTGGEIANSLGISQPAFSKQLRNSQRRLLKPLYEPESELNS